MSAYAQIANLTLVGHHDLAGNGNGGEGLALYVRDGRKYLYIAHLNAPTNYSVVDVTDPSDPVLVRQEMLPHAEVRSNSLSLGGDTLAIAYQTTSPGLAPAGVDLFDLADPTNPRLVAHHSTQGPSSRGAHFVWIDGLQRAFLASGSADFEPLDRLDDQFVQILDVADPSAPREIGRWWMPGTRVGEEASRPARRADHDGGFRAHNINVYPGRPDRAYVAYLDGGLVILDIADPARPHVVGELPCVAPLSGFTHTAVPILDRDLLVMTQESVKPNAGDHPKQTWLVDISDENAPRLVAELPMPTLAQYAARPGRAGAHNVHENLPAPGVASLSQVVVGAYFGAGLRIFDIADPSAPREIAHFVPADPAEGQPAQINDVIVGADSTIYTVDRVSGGLYVLEPDGIELS